MILLLFVHQKLLHSQKIEDFTSRSCSSNGCSVDSQFSHFAWRNSCRKWWGILEELNSIISWFSKSISRDYDVLFGESVALRGSFLIDADGTVRHAVIMTYH